ncbi:MAG: glycosyltransferase, partial [Desulfobacteraceae bacterium]|nr:glycosyltransferase [Desulfobacteraceae bacterium]
YARYPGKYRILHVGRKAEQKNLDTLIRALVELGPEYFCIFVGKGREDTYRKLAEQCGVDQQCHFIQSVHNEEISKYYSFCDCMCTPSRWEGFGIVFIEAMACETVVVTSDIAPMNEYITDSVSGVLVKDFENPAAIVEAIVRACQDESLRNTIQSNARKAAEPFRKERVDQLEMNLYKKFLNGSVDEKVRQQIIQGNPWYVGSQFEWAEKAHIKRIYEKRHRFFIECINRTKKRLGNKMRVLDAGCGDGYWLRKLKDLEGVELTGVDYNPLRIEHAKQVVPNVAVYHSDLMDFVSKEPFDIVFLSQVIEHVEDDVGLLLKTRSLLRDEGILILGTPNEGSYLHQERNRRLGASFTTDHVHFYTEHEIIPKLQQAGFAIESIMCEVFCVGDDDLYYKLLETQWGFELLEFMTFLVPSECSDFYFECRLNTTKNPPKGKYHPPELPTIQEIAQKLKQFGEQIKNIPDYPEKSNTGYRYLKLDQTERLKTLQEKKSTRTRSSVDRHAHYLSRLPIYRILAETDLSEESVRKTPGLAARLRTAGMKNTNLENYWKRVSFIARNCHGSVLELGCGCGNVTRYISQNNMVTNICAIDMQPEYVDQLRAYNFEKVEAICADVLTYQFSQKFDCVVIAELIEHLALNQECKLISNLCAILDQGATLIITTPIGFMPDADHVRGFTTLEFRDHLEQYYGKILKRGNNSIQQFAVVNFEPCLAKKTNPRVSVVLPTYNHLRFLPKAVESVLRQTFSDFELIIVNDGSTDGTREYLDSLKDRRVRIIHQENKRLPEALNTGFREARGELLTWISADNYCAPIFLEAFVAALDAYPDADFAYSAHAWIDGNDQITGICKDQDVSCHRLLASGVGVTSFMYRRLCQERVGLYDSALEGAEDWDMWLRILEQFQPVYVPEILCYYRRHRKSMTEKIKERIFRASQQTFQKAVKRRNNQFDMAELYPTIELCRDIETAKFYAYFDLGTTLLQSQFAQVGFACQALESALLIFHDSFEVAGNLALIYGQFGLWQKALPLLRRIAQQSEDPKALEVCRIIIEAHKTNRPDLLAKIPLFVPDKESIELFEIEKKQKRVFSFTDAGQRKNVYVEQRKTSANKRPESNS